MLKIGMIGAGFIGQLAHLMNFIDIKNCKVQALAELKPLLRKKVAARYDIEETYATHLELLQHSSVDAVIVVTPRAYTGPIVLDCLNAGKHVLSEKPMAGSIQQANLLLNAAHTKDVYYAVGYMKRFDEGVQIAKTYLQKYLESGELGTLIAVHAKCYMGNSYCNANGHVVTNEKVEYDMEGWPIAPQWLEENYHAPFGAYLNTYSHVTNLLRYLFEESPVVQYANITEHSSQLVVLGFKQFLATLETGKTSYYGWDEEIRITFSDGEIILRLPPALLKNVPAEVTIYQGQKIQERHMPFANWTWAFRNQAEAFVNDILNRKPMKNSAEEASLDLLLVENIWKKDRERCKSNQNVREEVA